MLTGNPKEQNPEFRRILGSWKQQQSIFTSCISNISFVPEFRLCFIKFFPGVSGAASRSGLSHHLAATSLAANQTVSTSKQRTTVHWGGQWMKICSHRCVTVFFQMFFRCSLILWVRLIRKIIIYWLCILWMLPVPVSSSISVTGT